MKTAIIAITVVIALPTPVYAQWNWGNYQYQQPYQDPYQRVTPNRTPERSEHRTHRSVTRHTEHHTEPPKPTIEYRTRVVTVVRPGPGKTWRDMNQDDGRDWVIEQAKAFCERYPTDKACKPRQE
jgi:hypothetical protein